MGIYRCFMRTNAQNEREHKVFIVVSGNCRNSNLAQVGMPEPFCGGTSALNNLMCRIISLSVSVQVPRTRPGPGAPARRTSLGRAPSGYLRQRARGRACDLLAPLEATDFSTSLSV